MFSRRWLFVTNTLSSGGLLALGDGIQQGFERHKGLATQHDWSRTGRMFAVGLSQGPPHHYWYKWLDRYISPRRVGLKILADQLLAAPFFAYTFFLGMGLMERKTVSQINTEFTKKFPTVYAFDWLIWPPTQYINFHYVPGKFRVLYVNAVTVVWDVFLSYMKHYDQSHKLQDKRHEDLKT